MTDLPAPWCLIPWGIQGGPGCRHSPTCSATEGVQPDWPSSYLLHLPDIKPAHCLLNVTGTLSRVKQIVSTMWLGQIFWQPGTSVQKSPSTKGQFYYITDETPHQSYGDLKCTLSKVWVLCLNSNLTSPMFLMN